MSNNALNWAWKQAIDRTIKFTLIAMADYADDETWICHPSHRQLGKRCDCTPRSVARHVDRLVEMGLVSKKARFDDRGDQTSNEYVLNKDVVITADTPMTQVSTPLDTDDTPRRHQCHDPLDTHVMTPMTPVSYIPSVEPSVEPSVPPVSPPPEIDAVDAWNRLADEINLPKVQKLTSARRSKLKARLSDVGGIEGWEVALSKIRASSFLNNPPKNGKHPNWRPDFDFILSESKFTKLMEGGYDDRTCGNSNPDDAGSAESDAAILRAARRVASGNDFSPGWGPEG